MTVTDPERRVVPFDEAARRRTVPARPRRRVLLAVLLLALAGLLGWLVWWSPVLAVREVRVLGTAQVSADQVRQAAGVQLGTPLARVSASEVAARVEAIGAVQGAEVRYGWPNTLVVVVTERTPVATVMIGGERLLVDGTGVSYALDGPLPAGLPAVQGAVGARAAAAGVLSALPQDLAAHVRWVRATSVDDVVLGLRSGTRVRWGADSDGARKAAVLAALLPQRPRQIDVSAPDLPTTRGGRLPQAPAGQ